MVLAGRDIYYNRIRKRGVMKPDNHLKLLYGIAILLFLMLAYMTYVNVEFISTQACLMI